MAKLYRETVSRLSTGEQANLMWQDEAIDETIGSRKIRRLPLSVQQKWDFDWKGTLTSWVMGLPRMPWKVSHPEIVEKEFRL